MLAPFFFSGVLKGLRKCVQKQVKPDEQLPINNENVPSVRQAESIHPAKLQSHFPSTDDAVILRAMVAHLAFVHSPVWRLALLSMWIQTAREVNMKLPMSSYKGPGPAEKPAGRN